MSWLEHIFGLDSLSGPIYGFWSGVWSGVGSDISEIAVIGGVYALARKHNCHAKGCWRLAKFPVAGTPFITCRKHHPSITEPVTAGQIHERFHATQRES